MLNTELIVEKQGMYGAEQAILMRPHRPVGTVT